MRFYTQQCVDAYLAAMSTNPLHAMWSSAAPSWGEHADFVDERGAVVGQAMLAAADVRPGDHVLELGCGPGGVGLSAAEIVGADGQVVLSDVAPEMTAIAAERAARRGLSNVVALELDMEHLEAPDSSYDKVLCREALMLVADPAAAAREALRVLRPGGVRGVGPARSQPVAQRLTRRNRRPARRTGSAPGNARPLRAVRRRRTRRRPRRRRLS